MWKSTRHPISFLGDVFKYLYYFPQQHRLIIKYFLKKPEITSLRTTHAGAYSEIRPGGQIPDIRKGKKVISPPPPSDYRCIKLWREINIFSYFTFILSRLFFFLFPFFKLGGIIRKLSLLYQGKNKFLFILIKHSFWTTKLYIIVSLNIWRWFIRFHSKLKINMNINIVQLLL